MASNNPPESRTAFFYGTLMAPQVLHRVCHGSMSPTNPIYTQSNLTTKPAILHNHRRHRVKSADYPAILPILPIPSTSSSNNTDSSTVRGTYVTGLTANDIWRLDIFEGDEYERRSVSVRILDAVGDAVTGEGNVEGEEVEAETYIWIAGEDRLEENEWDFGEFQREKMKFWVGAEGASDGVEAREDIVEVDEAVAARARAEADGTGGRGFNGHISSVLAEEHKRDEDVVRNAI